MRQVALAILGVAIMANATGAWSASAPAAWVIFVDPGDLVAVRVSGPPTVGGALESPDFYRPLVSRLTGNGLRDEDLLRTDPATLAEIQLRFRRAMSVAVDAMDAFQSAGDAPRGLILISNGYTRDLLATAEGQTLADTAIRNAVKVFAISGRFIESEELPRAVTADEWAAHLEASRNSLRDIAERTGGFAILTARELPAALQRMRVE